MSVRIAIIPFDGASPHNVHVTASTEGVELEIPSDTSAVWEQRWLPPMSPTAARTLSDALRNAADEADALARATDDEKFERRREDIDELIEKAKAAVPPPDTRMPLPKTPKASS